MEFLHFHTALMLIPVISLCLHPPCTLFIDAHISRASHSCVCTTFSPYRPRRSNTFCLLQAGVLLVHGDGTVDWAVAHDKDELLNVLTKMGNQVKAFQKTHREF